MTSRNKYATTVEAAAWSVGIYVAFMFMGGEAAAADIKTLAQNVGNQVGGIGQAAGAVSWLSGLGFGISSVFKFKQHADDPQRTSLKDPMMYGAVGAGLIMIPELMGAGIGSIFGGMGPTLNGNAPTPVTIGGR
jgi:hypothetical protein